MSRAAFDYARPYALEADRDDPVSAFPLRDRPAQADNEQGNKDQEDKTKIEAREASDFWRGVLSSRVGQREMFKLLRLTSAFEASPYAADLSGRQNDRLSDYKMGQMSVGHILYQMLAIAARKELFELQDFYNLHGDLAVRPDRQL